MRFQLRACRTGRPQHALHAQARGQQVVRESPDPKHCRESKQTNSAIASASRPAESPDPCRAATPQMAHPVLEGPAAALRESPRASPATGQAMIQLGIGNRRSSPPRHVRSGGIRRASCERIFPGTREPRLSASPRNVVRPSSLNAIGQSKCASCIQRQSARQMRSRRRAFATPRSIGSCFGWPGPGAYEDDKQSSLKACIVELLNDRKGSLLVRRRIEEFDSLHPLSARDEPLRSPFRNVRSSSS